MKEKLEAILGGIVGGGFGIVSTIFPAQAFWKAKEMGVPIAEVIAIAFMISAMVIAYAFVFASIRSRR